MHRESGLGSGVPALRCLHLHSSRTRGPLSPFFSGPQHEGLQKFRWCRQQWSRPREGREACRPVKLLQLLPALVQVVYDVNPIICPCNAHPAQPSVAAAETFPSGVLVCTPALGKGRGYPERLSKAPMPSCPPGPVVESQSKHCDSGRVVLQDGPVSIRLQSRLERAKQRGPARRVQPYETA